MTQSMVGKAIRRLLFKFRSADKWHAVEGYNELHGLLWRYGLPSVPSEFAEGPLRKFFQLALEPGQSAAQRCRILEHARHWAGRARDSFSDARTAAELSAAIAEQVDRVNDIGPSGEWVVKVFQGNALHHAAPVFPDDQARTTARS